MSRAQVEEWVNRVHSARLKNSTAIYLPQFAENATVQISGSTDTAGIPFVTNTTTDLEPILHNLIKTWEWLNLTIQSLIIEDNCAAVRYLLNTKHTPTNTVLQTMVMDQLEFNSAGKLVAFHEFVDTALVAGLESQVAD